MPEQFLHGVEVVEIDDGPRPIRTVKSSIIGLVGTAPRGPVNTPVLIAGSRIEAVKAFGAPGGGYSIPEALDGMFDQAGAMVVVINVADPTHLAHLTTVAAQPMAFDAAGRIDLGRRVVSAVTVLGPVMADIRLDAAGTITLPAAANVVEVGSLSGETVFVLDTDYTAAAGVITRLPGGGIAAGATLLVSYTIALTENVDYEVDDYAGVITRKPGGGIVEGATLDVGFTHLDPAKVLLADVIGGVDEVTGGYTGLYGLLAAQSVVKVQPRILIAPRFTHQRPEIDGQVLASPVVAEMLGIANRLRAVIIADGPNTTDSAAIDYREDFGSARLFVVDPWVKVWDTATNAAIDQPASARVAGMIARSDNERGFWWSPSNLEMFGIVGTTRPVDFVLGDTNCRANYLNENEVATIIQEDGYRLWGNRTCSSDPKWAFLSVRRTADMINDSVMRSHMWAVDRNIVKTYITDVSDGVNAYLRHLTVLGALLGGRCWADPELNTPDQISQGKVYFDFDFTPPYPAEHITFRSRMVNDYLEELFA
ncbi:MAG: phage tail sheath subtilisin-like domain-containing protein [Alphaproteobacteria bacterium]|nr:phage tail sheath subtilisin-like domain-containing protein [Alphaproteobacteria bacterium]